MSKYTLYAYVDGSDLKDTAEFFGTRFNTFINNRQWISPRVVFVDQIRDDQDDSPRATIPLWELGLNIDLAERNQRNPKWYDDITAIVEFLIELQKETGRDFVIGRGDNETGFSEDYLFITSVNQNTEDLKEFLD